MPSEFADIQSIDRSTPLMATIKVPRILTHIGSRLPAAQYVVKKEDVIEEEKEEPQTEKKPASRPGRGLQEISPEHRYHFPLPGSARRQREPLGNLANAVPSDRADIRSAAYRKPRSIDASAQPEYQAQNRY